MPKGYEYVEGLRQNHYERHYRNHTATRGIPLNSVERKKKKYFLRKLRAEDDGDQTTFASVPHKDSLLLVENLRGRLGCDTIFLNSFCTAFTCRLRQS